MKFKLIKFLKMKIKNFGLSYKLILLIKLLGQKEENVVLRTTSFAKKQFN